MEQRKISDYLSSIDNLITLHQRKQNGLFLLILGKKSSLILANDWEQRKLGELGKAQSGIGFPDKEQGGKKGIPFFKVSDMNNLGNELEMHIANNYVSLEQIKKNGWSPIEETSVIFAKVGAAIMLNRKRLVRFPFLLDNNTMAYKFNDAWEIDFGRTLFERIDLTSLVQVGALPSYNAGDVENMEVAIPQKAEQAKLGALFTSLDNLITLHQCKGNLVQNKFGLHSPFQMRCKLPDDWEQRKLSEIVSYTASALSAKDVSDSGCYDLYDANSVIGKTNDGVMDHEYITIIKDGAGVGRVRILPAKTAFIGTMGAMTAKNSSLSFVYAMLCSTDLSKRFSGSTIPHIYFKDYGQEQYCVPELCEQDKIAAVFSDIDNLITLHQCKRVAFFDGKRWLYFKFEESKNTLAWEQRKLGDIAIEVNRTDANSNAPIMMITANDGFIEQSERYAFNNAGESLKRYIVLQKGELAYNHGASKLRPYGSCFALINREKARIPFVYHCFSVENHNPEFVSIELNGNDVESQLRRIVSSGARMDGLLNISFQDYASISILLPKKTEQDKIARVFRNLDNLITLHQRGEKIYNRRQTW